MTKDPKMENDNRSEDRLYRIVEGLDRDGGKTYYVQVRGRVFWHLVKEFHSDDEQYALLCAMELTDLLREKI